MTGKSDLVQLLSDLNPKLTSREFVFVTMPDGSYGDYSVLGPIASFNEHEGLTLVVPRKTAELHSLAFYGTFRLITLQVHSSLDAVGLTATVATRLAEEDISANVIAAFFHDHIFVPATRADDALRILKAAKEQ